MAGWVMVDEAGWKSRAELAPWTGIGEEVRAVTAGEEGTAEEENDAEGV